MADSDIGLKAKVEGEKEFRSAMSDIRESFKVLGSEMKLVASQFDKNDASQSALAAKGEVLTKQVDLQREKVALLSKALEDSKAKYGENSVQTNKLQIDLNSAQASLNKMERELRGNQSALSEFARGQDAAGKATQTSAEKHAALSKEIDSTAKAYAVAVKEQGKGSSEAEALKKRLADLVSEQRNVGKSSDDMSGNLKQAHEGFKGLGEALKSGYKSALNDSADSARKVSDAYAGLGGLLQANVKKSFDDVKESIVGAAAKVVTGAGEMGGSIVQFVKDTVSGENTVKALGDALKDKLISRLRGTSDETDDLSKSLDKAGDELDDTGGEAKTLGKEMDDTGKKTSIFGGVLKASLAADAVKAGLKAVVDGVKAVAGAVVDFVGNNIIKGGFDRVMNLEQASFKLQGLGHDAENVARILDEDVTNAVKGTAFSLDAMAGVAAGALAAGVPEGKELEKTLSLVADSAAISGRSIDEMGAIFNKIATAGKISGKEINQLSQAGIPIMHLLADTTGNSIDKIQDLVKDGKIGMAEFQAAIEAGMGGAAKTMGETWKGSVDNMHAAMSRLGAKIVGTFTDDLKPAVHGITDLFDFVKKGTGLTGEEIQEKIVGIANDVKKSVEGLIANIGPILDRAIPIVMGLLDEIVKIIPGLLEKIVPVVVNLIGSLTGMLPGLLGTILPVLADGLMKLVGAIIEALPNFIEAAVKIVSALARGLSDALPQLIPAAIEAVLTIAQGLVDNIPFLLDVALKLILGLADGLLAAIPRLVAALPAIIDGIIVFLMEAIPQIIDAGVQLLSALVKAMPEIISAIVKVLPEIINGIVKELTENVAPIIDAGVQLLTAIIADLPKIIVTIVDALPEIIKGILGGLLSALPQLIDAGWQLLMGLLEGLFKAVPDLLKGVGNVLRSLLDAVLGFFGIHSPSTVFSGIGENLIKGLWNGISNMAKWVKDKILGFASGITDTIKDFFGIKSPSTVFAKMGENMAAGMGVGFGDEMDGVGNDMKKAVGGAGDLTAREAIDSINKGVVSNAKSLSRAVEAIVSQLLDGLRANSKHFTELGAALVDAMINGIQSAAAGKAASGVSSLSAGILQALRPIADSAVDIGANLVYGLWDGIEFARGWFFWNLRYFIEDIKNEFLSAFDIHSPSRWFRDNVGKNLAMGLGEGFEEAMASVSRDMRDAVPTDFDIDANISGALAGAAGGGMPGMISLALNIENFNNNSGQDLRQLASDVSVYLADEVHRRGWVT